MNKIGILGLVFICSISIFSSNVFALSNENINSSYFDTVCDELQRIDVVRDCKDKWSSEEYIKRRELFEMVYIVKTSSRELSYDVDDEEYFQKQKISFYKSRGFDGFDDVEKDTYDDYLTFTLVEVELLNGKETESGKRIAMLDDYATYEELLAIVGRLFYEETYYLDYATLPDMNSRDFYFELLCKKGLINLETDVCSIEVDKSMMDDKVPAHTALCLVYKSLYTPTIIGRWKVISGYYYINNFLDKGKKLEIEEGTAGIEH